MKGQPGAEQHAGSSGHEGKKYGELREETTKKREAIEKMMST